MTIGKFGIDGFGTSPYGGSLLDFGVQSAVSLGHTTVRVRFTDLVDFTYGPIHSPGNYTITPTLNVVSVAQESAQSVVLTTDLQSTLLYTVTVGSAKGYNGQNLDLNLNSATFNGSVATATYFAVATAPDRVRAVFQQAMMNDVNLSNPSNYLITDLQGNPIPVTSATPEQTTHPSSVILLLGTPLKTQNSYVMDLSVSVTTEGGQSCNPLVSQFSWVSLPANVSVPVDAFSGEVLEGLYGIHGGLVFFSPALTTPIGNSIIQVDEVDVCTRAYDSYHFPKRLDPFPLYTHGDGIVPTIYPTFLNQNVLWAPFPRLMEARFELTFTGGTGQLQERVPPPQDGSVSVTFKTPFDPTRVALLNNLAWYLFNNTGTTVPPTFITADNLTPIPEGPTTMLVLYVPLGGDSGVAATPTASYTVAGSSVADSQLEGVLHPPNVVLVHPKPTGDSSVAADATTKYSAGTTMTADSAIHATLTKLP